MEAEKLTIIIVICAYFALLIGIGWWHSRKIKNASDYILAGRGLSFWAFVLLLTGSAASGMTILGTSGLGYFAGWPSFWEQFCVPLSCSFCMIFFGVKLSRLAEKRQYLTIEDYLCERYYSQRTMRLLSSVVVLLVSAIYLVGQFLAVGLILSWMLDIRFSYALVLGAVITMCYVLLGGLRAIASIASMQVIIMIAGVLVLCPMIISQAPDFSSVLAGIDENMTKVVYPQADPPYAKYAFFTPLYALSFVMFLTCGLASAPHIVSNVLAVSKKSYFKWAPLVIFGVYFTMMAVIKMSGFAARAMAERGLIAVKQPDESFIKAVEYILADYKIFAALAGTVVLAAVMTTTDRLMLTIGNCVSWDIYKKYVHKTASDRLVNIINRVTVAVTTLVAMFAALQEFKLLAFLIWAAIGVMFSSFTVPLLGGLYWRRATKAGAIASMGIGFVSAVVFAYIGKYVKPLPVHFSLFSFCLALISFVGVSLLTRKPDESLLDLTETGAYIQAK